MQPLGDARYHLRLLGLMGKTTGAGMVEAFEEGRISSSDWAGMVESCRACGCVERCERWLSAHESAAHAPEGCNNAKCLAQLRTAKEAEED